MLLRKLGYEILVAPNGREALSTLEIEARKGRAHEVQAILMDASMDVMDGMECTRVIRAQQLPHRTRPFIIAQTGQQQHTGSSEQEGRVGGQAQCDDIFALCAVVACVQPTSPTSTARSACSQAWTCSASVTQRTRWARGAQCAQGAQ